MSAFFLQKIYIVSSDRLCILLYYIISAFIVCCNTSCCAHTACNTSAHSLARHAQQRCYKRATANPLHPPHPQQQYHETHAHSPRCYTSRAGAAHGAARRVRACTTYYRPPSGGRTFIEYNIARQARLAEAVLCRVLLVG